MTTLQPVNQIPEHIYSFKLVTHEQLTPESVDSLVAFLAEGVMRQFPEAEFWQFRSALQAHGIEMADITRLAIEPDRIQ